MRGLVDASSSSGGRGRQQQPRQEQALSASAAAQAASPSSSRSSSSRNSAIKSQSSSSAPSKRRSKAPKKPSALRFRGISSSSGRHNTKRSSTGESRRGGGNKNYSRHSIDSDEDLHAGSDRHPDRRTGLVWDSTHAHGARLHSVDSRDRHVKSCMKVATLEESLRQADANDRERRERRRREGRGNFSLFPLRNRATSGGKKEVKRSGSGGDGDGEGTGTGTGTGVNRDTTDGGGGRGRRGSSGVRGGGLVRGLSKRGLSKMHLVLHHRNEPAAAPSPSAPTAAQTTTPTPERHVQFSTLLWRWYPLLAVDNPGVSKGNIAIGIDWKYEEDDSPTPVDTHEHHRRTAEPRRKLREIKLSQEERERRLTNSGVTKDELDEMRTAITEAKKKRLHTLEMSMDDIRMRKEERREGMWRKLKKMLRVKKNYEEEEEELWDLAQERSVVAPPPAAAILEEGSEEEEETDEGSARAAELVVQVGSKEAHPEFDC